MTEQLELEWIVTMLGPSRVGKTSLLTALQVAANTYFEGTPVRVKPEDEITRKAFADNNNLMIGELQAGRFSPDMAGSVTENEYRLTVDAGSGTHRLILTFRDYPGGYLTNDKNERVTELLEESPTVIVPIDSTLLMEAGDEHSQELVDGLCLSEVQDQVREWAKTRFKAGDYCHLILVPMKCESYFNDNGGRHDEADRLFRMTQRYYRDIVQTYRRESHSQDVLYAPVDTIGPIQLMDVLWVDDPSRPRKRMKPSYSVRRDTRGNTLPRRIKGAEPVLASIVGDLLRTQEAAIEDLERAEREKIANIEVEGLRRRSNWFKRFVDTISGRSSDRQHRISEARRQLNAMDESLKELAYSKESIKGDSERVRVWP